MNRSWLLPAMALLGAVIAVYAVIDTNRPVLKAIPAAASAVAPFTSYVAGTGIAEAGRGNVAIGTAVFGVVSDVYVRVGDEVQAGAALFKLDDRSVRARLAVAQAKADEAAAALAKPQHKLEFITRLQHENNNAISASVISDVRDDARAATSELATARATVAQIEVDLERSLVHAPAPGRILQVNIRAGEYVEGAGLAKPLLLLGDDARIYLRVDIDENDAWRVQPNAPARAFVRGNPQLQVALRFENIEPYVVAKTSLTGQSTERSDVRVLQVIYSFERSSVPVYLGQQMDVFIEAPTVPVSDTKSTH